MGTQERPKGIKFYLNCARAEMDRVLAVPLIGLLIVPSKASNAWLNSTRKTQFTNWVLSKTAKEASSSNLYRSKTMQRAMELERDIERVRLCLPAQVNR